MVPRLLLLVLVILLIQAVPADAGQLNVNGLYLACSQIEAPPGNFQLVYFDVTVGQDVVVQGGEVRQAVYASFLQASFVATPGFLAIGVIDQSSDDAVGFVAQPNQINVQGLLLTEPNLTSFGTLDNIPGTAESFFRLIRAPIVGENCLSVLLFPQTLTIPAASLIFQFSVTIQGSSNTVLGIYLPLNLGP